MAQCTAPRRGHHTASGRAACPACGGGGGYRGYGSYSSYSYPTYPTPAVSGGSRTSSGGSNKTSRPRWSKSSASGPYVGYTSAEVVALTPVREAVEKIAVSPTRRDYFLCHAWDDRTTSAKLLHDGIEAAGASVWFSEKDIGLGTPLMREIDKGLANSRVGLVLVTPPFCVVCLRRVSQIKNCQHS